MKKKFVLYLAAPGTYDPALTTTNLTPMELKKESFKKDLRAIKKQLKLSCVVALANEYNLENTNIPYILVVPKTSIENIWFYRDSFELDSYTKYMYPLLISKLKTINSEFRESKLELIKEMLLNEYIEGIDL